MAIRTESPESLRKTRFTGFCSPLTICHLKFCDGSLSISILCFYHCEPHTDFRFCISKESTGCSRCVEFGANNLISVCIVLNDSFSSGLDPCLDQLYMNRMRFHLVGKEDTERRPRNHVYIKRRSILPFGPVL